MSAAQPSHVDPGPAKAAPLLAVEDLSVEFATDQGWLRVTDHVSLTVHPEETVGLVGESGSGKSVTALSVMGLLPPRASRIATGSVQFEGRELLNLSTRQMNRIRGDDMSMIFQEPMSSLNPAFTVGEQIAEQVRHHRGWSRKRAWERAVEILDLVGIPEARRRTDEYPHNFSGGMRQRVMIAMALSCEPRLLIADEPTTALDVTIQALVLELLQDLQERFRMAVLFVTHDLGVVADLCDRVNVMYAGQVVEEAGVDELFTDPTHPYTEGLLQSMPQTVGASGRLWSIPGVVPPPFALPSGCRFHPRCQYAVDGRCDTDPVQLVRQPNGNNCRCVRARELDLTGAQ